MFGAIGYLPTYLQMAFSVNATESGLLMIPMLGALLVASVLSGQPVSKTGQYKWMPIAGSILVALVLLSTLKPGCPLWEICVYLAVMGLGLGRSMQILVLIVQNSLALREVGTATASNNLFRQIGAALGSASVGSLFASRLADLLGERLPAAATGGGTPGGSNSLTPAVVNHLPAEIKDLIVSSYNDALTPIFIWIVPLAGEPPLSSSSSRRSRWPPPCKTTSSPKRSLKATSSSPPTTSPPPHHDRAGRRSVWCMLMPRR